MDIFDVNLKDGMTFFTENGILSIAKLKDVYRYNFKEECSFCETLESTMYVNQLSGFCAPYRLLSSQKESVWIGLKLKYSYIELIKEHLFDLDETYFIPSRITDFCKDCDNSKPYFILAFNKDKIKEIYNASKISKKVLQNLYEISINLAIKSIWNAEKVAYTIKYFNINKKTLNMETIEKVFYGPTIRKNGIQKYLKETYNEIYLKPLATKKIPSTKTYISQLWKNIYITPNIIKENIPEITINNYGELIELSLGLESELFSKVNFATEILFCSKGNMGSLLQSFIRKRINKAVKVEGDKPLNLYNILKKTYESYE